MNPRDYIRGIVCLLACGWTAGVIAGELSEINNYHEISPSLSTAGKLQDTDIEQLAEQGFEVVVDLRIIDDEDPEPGQVSNAGMVYRNVPVSSKQPEAGALDAFLAVMRENEGKKILVHCRSNKRAAVMTYLYQVIAQGADKDQALQHVLAINEPNETWQAYINDALAAHSDQE